MKQDNNIEAAEKAVSEACAAFDARSSDLEAAAEAVKEAEAVVLRLVAEQTLVQERHAAAFVAREEAEKALATLVYVSMTDMQPREELGREVFPDVDFLDAWMGAMESYWERGES